MMEGNSSDQFSGEGAKNGYGYGYGNAVMYLTGQGKRAQSLSLAGHALASSEALEENIKVGSFYEVDHSKLPPKTPEQLYSIRVVMVSEKTALNVSLRFPSVHSLRTHFSDGNYGKPEGKKLPALDEKYVMVSGLAAEVLYSKIPTQEVAEGGSLWSFWASPALPPEKNGVSDVVAKKGSCWSELKFTGMVQWGRRRQVRFLNRHEEYKLGVSAGSENPDDGDIEAKKEENERGSCDEEADQEEKEEEVLEEEVKEYRHVKKEAEELEVKIRRSSKRKLHGKNSKTENLKRARSDQKQNQKVQSKSKKKPLKNSIERWSAARYKLAEENMLKIMKAKGAFFGNPILRPALRTEARKLIGDTGLLDHLLKHMAGKVAPGGTDRFRRRHNSDGAMEYWIESADLVNIRKQAGVQDPYWTPPPGWKPGDNPTQDPVSAREIRALKEEMSKIKKKNKELKQLKEEMGKMKKDVEKLSFKKPVEDFTVVFNPNTKLASSLQSASEDSLQQMKKMHGELVNRKAKIEEQLMEISESLSELEGQIRTSKSRDGTQLESEAPPLLLMAPPISTSDSETRERKEIMGSQKTKSGDQGGDKPAATVTEDKAAKMQRLNSGFRICKPHGTFLWPNMATFPSQAAVVHPDDNDPLVVPTPTSASSSTTSAPQPHQIFQGAHSQCGPNPPSPVKPLAEKRPVKPATLCTVSKLCSSSRSSSFPPQKTPNSQIMTSTIKTTTSLINLNETPDDQNNIDDAIFESRPLQRRPSNVTDVAAKLVPTEKGREAGAEGKENGMSYCELEQKQQRECSSTLTSRVPQMGQNHWLALVPQDPALNNYKQG